MREARERVRAALVNCGFEFPLRRIVVNLAPASLRKAGPGMDLAIAAALLIASGQLELGGAAAAGAGRRAGARRLGAAGPGRAGDRRGGARGRGARRSSCRPRTGPRRRWPTGIERDRARRASASCRRWRRASGRRRRPQPLPLRLGAGAGAPDLADLRGQPHLRHALEVAAAGGHSLLMVGPPGAGKSLAASRLPSILPPLAPDEALEVARIASACGRLERVGVPGGRPFRAPHHTISAGGPGRRRQPAAARARRRWPTAASSSSTSSASSAATRWRRCGRRWRRAGSRSRAPAPGGSLPCRFMLVAAANPCPCGRGEADPDCSCAPLAVQRYQGRLSGALADRIDILAAVRQPSAAEIGGAPGEPSAAVRERVVAARERQERRLGPGRCNAEMTPAEARDCALEPRAPPRCSPSPTRASGSAAAPTTGSCGWRRRSPTSPAREAIGARADGAGAAAAEAGTE